MLGEKGDLLWWKKQGPGPAGSLSGLGQGQSLCGGHWMEEGEAGLGASQNWVQCLLLPCVSVPKLGEKD